MTLIELLISISISLFILAMLLEIFLATQKNHLILSALTHLEENANVAIQLLTNSIRTAGYTGCAHSFTLKSIDPSIEKITIHHASPQTATLLEPLKNKTQLHATQEPLFAENKILLISSCQSAELFSVKKITPHQHTQFIQSQTPLYNIYPAFSEISEWETQSFYVARTGRFTAQGQPVSALYMNKTELVEGIDKIQFRYAVLLDHTVIEKNAEQLQMNEKIVGVAIALTLSSLELFPLQKKAYAYVALREV